MPVEHLGLNPKALNIQFLKGEDAESNKPVSKSPLYNRPHIPEQPLLDDENALEIIKQINFIKQKNKIFEQKKMKNEQFVS